MKISFCYGIQFMINYLSILITPSILCIYDKTFGIHNKKGEN